MLSADIGQPEMLVPSTIQSKEGPLSTCPTSTEGQGSPGPNYHTQERDIGKLVWAKLGRDRWWPGTIVPGPMARMPSADPGYSWVYWFGDHKISQIAAEKIVPFVYNFSHFFGKKTGKLYQSAISEALQVCVMRCGIVKSEDAVLQWAVDGFCIPQGTRVDQATSPFDPTPGEELPRDVLENLKKVYNKVSESVDVETKSRSRDSRDSALDIVKAGQKKLEEVCIACDDNEKSIHCSHPLFEGGLCKDCKDELTETLYCYGSDGTSVYCAICGFGGELFVCDNLNKCGKAYCTECMELFLGEDTVAKIRKANEWQCFMCTQYSSTSHGCLHPHKDWQQRIIKLFDTGYRVTEPDLGYLSCENKHQIRVLSLFDGIGTAKLILDNLNIDIDKYYSSEIDEDALLVSSVHHGSEVIQIGDVTKLNEEKLRSLCPIDLVIGGSPCNDFSLANPVRKGFEFGGTGMLFFHFYRVLKSVQNFNVGRHLFWLYENVASMKSEYKKEMSLFLECDPALWDSKFFSPQTRARYFWGNIPGMYSTPELSEQYWSNFHLDTMLSPHCNRKATVDRIRTVTTRTNSLKQGKKDDMLPVMMNGKEDNIWISELERVFGFPPHYTDVGNLPTTRRQRLLGKSWSVPVVQHILSPLTQYFAIRKASNLQTECLQEGE
ncbi:DNA (cytosine-5)-methyltransferase 3A-like [Pecten maximus]|uniref:DNA (cytosine-5)-methyltransferase 3A-like n=1 Tax=Pecten maximus TaxID=6579 RepID=UPI001457E8C2|nr:DNA (cytosine-5)-methyltransferase 3A-like [Pecten maximus]